MIEGLTYVIVTTPDVPRARRFYTETLGLSTEDDQGDVFSQFTTREGALWAVREPAPGAEPAGVELYLKVDDLDAAFATWKARGVRMVTEPVERPFGRMFSFKDMDGRTLHAWTPA